MFDWLQHIKFVWPENFLLLAVIPYLVWRYVQVGQRKQGSLLASGIRPGNPITFRMRLRHLPFILRLLAIASLVIALARPQHQTPKSRTEGSGIDIVLCMDVSGSMAARDISPSRLQAAKDVAMDFVKSRPVDRIGLVIFSGESFTKCPITPDKNTLLSQIESLEIRDGGYLEQGTLIGEGLATSVNRIIKGNAKSRVIILLTDGKEDAPETRIIDPLTAMDIAKVNKVKVYCIGMGGGLENAGEQIAPGGGLVKDYIDEDLLKRISSETGGRYYRAVDKASLQAIYAQIDKLEKSKVDVIKYFDIKELYVYFVLVTLGLLLLEVILRFTWLRKFP